MRSVFVLITLYDPGMPLTVGCFGTPSRLEQIGVTNTLRAITFQSRLVRDRIPW